MTRKKKDRRTPGDVVLTETRIEELAAKAEAGFNVEETLRRRRGRPPIGSAAASVESVRLDPKLRQSLVKRAASDEESVSSVIRKALHQYLATG